MSGSAFTCCLCFDEQENLYYKRKQDAHFWQQGNPLQYSCLGNPKDRGAWWATVHGVAKSWTRLKRFSTRAHNRREPRGHLLQLEVKEGNWDENGRRLSPRTSKSQGAGEQRGTGPAGVLPRAPGPLGRHSSLSKRESHAQESVFLSAKVPRTKDQGLRTVKCILSFVIPNVWFCFYLLSLF